MYEDANRINTEKLRNDLENDLMGAFFGGGYGGAFVQVSDVRRASPDELIRIAKQQGLNINDYIES